MSTEPDGPDATAEPDPSEGDRVGAPRARDLRAKDVLSRSEAEVAELAATLAPTELAELEQWFARPSRVVVEERLAEEGSDEYLADRYAERQVRIAEACKAIEPRMIALLDRHTAAVDRTIRVIEPPPSVIDETIITLTPPPPSEDGQIGDARDYIRDGAIEDALAQAAPQAVLRDLYRPESEFQLQFTNPFFDEAPPDDPWIELRASLRERRAMPPRLATYETGATAKREFRELIAGPWADKIAAVKAARGG